MRTLGIRLGLVGVAAAALLALMLVAGAATSQATPPAGGWFEGNPPTDAGDTLKTAQLPIGDGAHTSITGNLRDAAGVGDVNDADLYQVCLTGDGTFSATTNPTTAGASADFDSQLFLFNSNGLGVYGNDDSKGGAGPSLLPAGHALTPSAPGVYYLAISSFNNDPQSTGGDIFPGDSNAVEGPTGPGGGSPLSGWSGDGGSSGRYVIVLTGAIFCRPPTIEKDPDLHNLWLCNTGASTCVNKPSGVQVLNIDVNLTNAIKVRDPKCVAAAELAGTNPGACPLESIGSFEFEVRYDAKLVTVEVFPGDVWGGPTRGPGAVSCAATPREGSVNFRCNTKGKEFKVNGPGSLAVVRVRPTADVYSILTANQLNGIATQLINQDCQLSDTQGHPIDLELLLNGTGSHDICPDADVTIRYLEGDVHADCIVDAIDQQQIAFRWGSRLGNLLYNSRMDLEPSQPIKGDGDIDAKDLQFVYGRHGSTCKAPHPAQDPVDPKAKPPTPAE